MKQKVILNILNLCLIIAIIAVLFLTFHKNKISGNCGYDTIPIHILPILKKEFPLADHRLKAIMVFNEFPQKKDIEMMSKIYKIYQSKIDLVAFFLERFKQDYSFDFPFRFLGNNKFLCKTNSVIYDKNFFILLDENKVKFVDLVPSPQLLALLLNKNLHLETSKDHLQREELESKLFHKIHHDNINLWNHSTQKMESICLTGSANEIRFYHSGCSSCELKRILDNTQLSHIQSERSIISILCFRRTLAIFLMLYL